MDPMLRAVLEEPCYDLARLVYADYIEERGQSVRANYIRLSIVGEATRAEKLLSMNRMLWERLAFRYNPQWARGFVDTVYMQWRDVLAVLPALVQEHPLTRVCVCGLVQHGPQRIPDYVLRVFNYPMELIRADTYSVALLDWYSLTWARQKAGLTQPLPRETVGLPPLTHEVS